MPTSALLLEAAVFPNLFASSLPLQERPAPATEPTRWSIFRAHIAVALL